MKASIELSLYPLSEDYTDRIIRFIEKLKEYKNVHVVVNGMSTQLFGEFDVLMDLLKHELKEALENHRTMAVLKIGEGELTTDKIPNHLQ